MIDSLFGSGLREISNFPGPVRFPIRRPKLWFDWTTEMGLVELAAVKYDISPRETFQNDGLEAEMSRREPDSGLHGLMLPMSSMHTYVTARQIRGWDLLGCGVLGRVSVCRREQAVVGVRFSIQSNS